jgi:hypothetical protein
MRTMVINKSVNVIITKKGPTAIIDPRGELKVPPNKAVILDASKSFSSDNSKLRLNIFLFTHKLQRNFYS